MNNRRETKDPAIEDGPTGATLSFRAVPRASRTQLLRGEEGGFRLRVAAPPVDGEANAEMQRYFAKLLGVAKSRIELLAGQSGRQKRIRVQGMNADALARALQEALP
jgi:uncharacterized protein YggU (UPF0235/DUF167 family)